MKDQDIDRAEAERSAERALRVSEERFRTTFEHAAVGMAIATLDHHFAEANQKFCRILGYSVDELRSLTFHQITHPDDREETRAQVQRLQAGEIPSYALEKRYLRKDGAIVWSRTTVTLLRGEDGAPHRFIGIIEDIDDRKRAEGAARDAAERFQLALAAGDLGNWSWDAGTDVVTLSPRAAAIFGLPADLPTTWAAMRERLLPEDGVRAGTAVERALADHTDYNIEYRVRRPSGERCWVAARGRGVYDGKGAVQGMIGMVQEITDRKEREKVQARLAAVVESSDDAIISKTLDGVVTTWNQGAERIFGYPADEMIGQPITRLIPPELGDEEPSILARLRRGERIEHYETIRVRKDGTRLPVSLSVSPLKDPSGVIVGASKIARDITEQRLAKETLLDESRILEILNRTGRAIGAQLDLHALVQTVTDAATELSGAQFGAFFYNVLDAEGESYLLYALSGAPREAFEKFGLPRNTPVFNPTFRGEGVVRSPDITRDPRYGTMSPHHGMPKGHLPVRSYLAVPVVSRSGEVIGGLFFGHPGVGVFTERAERLVVGVAAQAAIGIDNARLYEAAQREIASRERAEAALRETDRRKDEFLATLAHELRNPLAPIRQAAVISKAAGASDAQKRWSHDVISRQVHHMALLLDDLLDISRITRGTLELRPEMTELQAVVDAAVETARPAIDAKRHAFTLEMPAPATHFAADPLRLAQVLANLLTNAAKYTDPEGRIHLRAEASADAVTIVVTDNGIGIPPESLGVVFDMFSQVKSSQDRSEGGLGIGLALAKGLVELHGGTLEAGSGGRGKGSTFVVRIPRRTLGASRRAEVAPTGSGPGVRRRVLIADDNQDAADSLSLLLRTEGHEVTVVHDGEAALAAFDPTPPDVALLDIGMPRLNGYDVARAVRERHGRKVTLIALTGWGQDSDKARALDSGFDLHFTKPVEPERLTTLLGSRDLREPSPEVPRP